jgi:acetyl-CoA/propionyl-CoA carboxylase biotin carboxyl carrier protein
VLDLSDISSGASGEIGQPDKVRRETEVEVNGKRFDVAMWVPAPSGSGRSRPRRSSGTSGGGGAGSGQVAVPMQGTIVKIMVEVGDEVEAGQSVIVLEAMKMENNVNADKSGTVIEIKVAPGDTVGGGDVVLVIE